MARLAFWVLVILVWVVAATAQVPENVEQAVRYQAQAKAAASAENVSVLETMNSPSQELDANAIEQRSAAQLRELGYTWSISKGNASQLSELGYTWSISKGNASQLNELGYTWSISKGNASQLNELGYTWSISKGNASQLNELGYTWSISKGNAPQVD